MEEKTTENLETKIEIMVPMEEKDKAISLMDRVEKLTSKEKFALENILVGFEIARSVYKH